MKALLRLLAIALVLWLPAAWAGPACEQRKLAPEEVRKAMQMAWKTRQFLEQGNSQVAIVGRAGANLAEHGLRYSHAGLILREHVSGPWLFYHLLNSCGTDHSGLFDEGLVTPGFMLEFLQSHTNVIHQPPYHSAHYSGINPYALGFAMWRDIRRICERPDEEDRAWFPQIAGSDWRDTFDFAMQNFKDESFIAQYLSPRLMREFRFFTVEDDDMRRKLQIGAIHNEDGYRALRAQLSQQYDLGQREPNIQVWNVDLRGDRSLTLRHFAHHRRPLDASTEAVVDHLAYLWGFVVRLQRQNANGSVELVCEKRHEKRSSPRGGI